MRTRWSFVLTSPARRALAAAALLAQCLMVFAPMGDLQDGDATLPTLAASVASAGGETVATPLGHHRTHDPATCPACIAQSLHAQTTTALAVPVLSTDSRAPIDLRGTFVAHHDPPATHQSRAPPVVS